MFELECFDLIGVSGGFYLDVEGVGVTFRFSFFPWTSRYVIVQPCRPVRMIISWGCRCPVLWDVSSPRYPLHILPDDVVECYFGF